MRTCSRDDCSRPMQVRGMCNSHYQTKRQKWIKAGLWQRPVPAVGTRRRLQALVAIGYSQTQLCRMMGITDSRMSHIIRGGVIRTSAATADKVVAVYDQISMTPGPSEPARARAHRKGWAPPLAWDDDTIDNPDAHPDLGVPEKVSYVERYRELRDIGYDDFEIADRFRIQPASLLRQLIRHGVEPTRALLDEANFDKRSRREVAS